MRDVLGLIVALTRVIVILTLRGLTSLQLTTRNQPRFVAISVFVAIAHGCALIILWQDGQTTIVTPAKQQLAVQTIVLKPPPKPRATVTKPVTPKSNRTPRRSRPTQKKKSPSSRKSSVKEDPKQKALLQEALASLDKLGEPSSKKEAVRGAVPLLTLDGLSKSEAEHSPATAAYCEELVRRLQLLLRLPDYGEVRLKLTLKRDGSVDTLHVVSAVSEENRRYVEGTIPGKRFPPFGNNFSGESRHTFLLALANE